ncbi:NADH-quinone oxidoreductase subunit N [Bacteroidetes/Chlorobi group bacterium ChocPot_Mid]|jgi:NADH-quinone oxidoreductase subunit N|nr:MAG: NADH-quinone oxidoreductase subunit N [Bacteroidetes/Chlorobi group bacterium ChocPot_Mid]
MIDQFIIELQKSISLFKPEATLAVTFVVALIADLIFKKSKNISGYISLIGFIVTFYFLFWQKGQNYGTFTQMLSVDPFALFFKFLILLTSFFIILMSFFSKELYINNRSLGEYFSLIAGMTFGMFLLVGANNLIMIYLAIETMSISSYILAGYTKEIHRASEASLKYVIFGAVSSGLMIYGISILFGLTGTLNLFEINNFIANNNVNIYALFFSVFLILAGIGYKISAVPFHFWTPDVYEGAPITITALLSVASKAAGFAVLIRFVKAAFIDNTQLDSEGIWILISNIDWRFIIAVLSVLSMTLGNLVALWQTNLKRLLAYSSIAHAGYMLMGVAVMTDAGVTAVMIYFASYLFMNLGAFFVVTLLANKIGSEDIDDYKGIGYRAPILGVCMVVFLLSLTGLPPTFGFIGKWMVFSAVLESNFIWLAVIGVLNSVVSLFYYVKIFRNMYVRGVEENENKENYQFHPIAIIVLLLLAIPTILFCLYPGPIANWAAASVGIFLG